MHVRGHRLQHKNCDEVSLPPCGFHRTLETRQQTSGFLHAAFHQEDAHQGKVFDLVSEIEFSFRGQPPRLGPLAGVIQLALRQPQPRPGSSKQGH